MKQTSDKGILCVAYDIGPVGLQLSFVKDCSIMLPVKTLHEILFKESKADTLCNIEDNLAKQTSYKATFRISLDKSIRQLWIIVRQNNYE